MFSELNLPACHTRVQEGQTTTGAAQLKIGFYGAEHEPLKFTATVSREHFDEFALSPDTVKSLINFITHHATTDMKSAIISPAIIAGETQRRYSYRDPNTPAAVAVLQRQAFKEGVEFALRQMEALGALPTKTKFI